MRVYLAHCAKVCAYMYVCGPGGDEVSRIKPIGHMYGPLEQFLTDAFRLGHIVLSVKQ